MKIHKHNKKGFTLVEVLVAVAITVVLMAIAVAMLTPATRLLNAVKSNAGLDIVCDTAAEYVRGSIQSADAVGFTNFSTGSEDAVKNLLADIRGGAAVNVHVLSVMKLPDGSGYRLYDYGTLTPTVADISGLISNEHRVFNEDFYAGTDLSFKISSDSNTADGAITVNWLKLDTQSMNGTEPANQPRTLSFKMLNGSARLSGTGSYSTDDGNLLIVYRKTSL